MSAEHDTAAANHESTPAPPTTEAAGPQAEALLADALPAAPALLANPNIGGRGNAPVRQAALRQMQRTYGNRATQRFLDAQAATASLSASVQREPAPTPAPAPGAVPPGWGLPPSTPLTPPVPSQTAT